MPDEILAMPNVVQSPPSCRPGLPARHRAGMLLFCLLGCAACGGKAGPPGSAGPPGEPAASCEASKVVEIQACIDSLSGHPGTILVRSGLYVLSKHIHIPTSGIHLVGEGSGATILKVGDQACQAAIIVGTLSAAPTANELVSDVAIAGLSIDGNKSGNVCCETEPGAPHLTVNGISVYDAQDISVSDVKIERARSGGITTDRGVYNLVVSNATVRESFWDGIALYRTSASRVENSLVEKNGAAAVSMDWYADRNMFANNLFLNNGRGEQLDTSSCANPAKPGDGPGIYLAGVSENVFVINVVSGNTNNGIEIKEGSDNPPPASVRNYFSGNTIAENINNGIWVTPQCRGCLGNVGVSTRYYCNTLFDLDVMVPIPVSGAQSDYYQDVASTSGDKGTCP